MRDNVGKTILSEFLSFLKFKVDNDLLTMEEVESISKTIEENISVLGTTDDFASFYKQPKTNISSVINRRMIQKPIRRVFYSFNSFRKIIPEKWRRHTNNTDNQ